MAITHPTLEQLDLTNILAALGDTTRLAMLGRIADARELSCGELEELGSKTVLSYHMAKLREAGLIQVRAQSTRRFVSLRRDDLEARFPGLLDSILTSARGRELEGDIDEVVAARADTYDWLVD